jgi:hypothetical protein
MTAAPQLCLRIMLGERPFPKADRSLGRKDATDAFGSAAPGRDREMQPFTSEFVRVGIYDP